LLFSKACSIKCILILDQQNAHVLCRTFFIIQMIEVVFYHYNTLLNFYFF